MARKIRIENSGFHHILNRGVERRVIFDTTQVGRDKINQFQKEETSYKTNPKKTTATKIRRLF